MKYLVHLAVYAAILFTFMLSGCASKQPTAAEVAQKETTHARLQTRRQTTAEDKRRVTTEKDELSVPAMGWSVTASAPKLPDPQVENPIGVGVVY